MSILPRFAAIVCRTTMGMRSLLPASPRVERAVRVRGTKVRSETSFVMNILEKKQSPTSTMES